MAQQLRHVTSKRSSEAIELKQERKRLFRIFPQKVWKKILNHITEVDDLESLNFTSPFFQTRLLSKRVLFLFPQVWPIISTKYQEVLRRSLQKFRKTVDGEMVSVFEWCGVNACLVCNRIQYLQNHSGILKLRLVCKAWCFGVDNYCEYSDYQEANDWVDVNLSRPSVVRDCLKHFEKTHGNKNANKNPFVGRAIQLSWDYQSPCNDYVEPNNCAVDPCDTDVTETDSETDDEFGIEQDTEINNEWEDVASVNSSEAEDFLDDATLQKYNLQVLLKNYGSHVWYCDMSLYDKASPSKDCYLWLTTILKLMPNLRVLKMDFRENIHEKRERRNIKWNVRDFPKLQHLEYFEAYSLCGVFLKRILKRNPEIPKLKVSGYLKGIDFNYDIFVYLWYTLTEVSLPIRYKADFRKLMDLELYWKLEKLCLEFDEYVGLGWSEIFSKIENKWGNTLIVLEVELPGSNSWDINMSLVKPNPELKLNLPNLRHLKLGYLPNYRWLDFVLPMKNTLEILEVSYQAEAYENVWKILFQNEPVVLKEDGRLEMLQMCGAPVENHIWTVFPNLKYIRLVEDYFLYGKALERKAFSGRQRREEWEKGMNIVWKNCIIR